MTVDEIAIIVDLNHCSAHHSMLDIVWESFWKMGTMASDTRVETAT